jgi:cystathionine gamma-synthase
LPGVVEASGRTAAAASTSTARYAVRPLAPLAAGALLRGAWLGACPAGGGAMEVDPATWLAHAGEEAGTGAPAEPGAPVGPGALRRHGAPAVPPIVAASYFTSLGLPDEASFHYARNRQPTWEALEEALGGLEDASATVFASGQAATLALILALTEDRSRLLMAVDGYYNARQLAGMLEPRGIEPAFVDLEDSDLVERVLAERPAVLWAESPTNPLLRVFDLAGLARIAARHGAPMVVDNTTATALLQRPLELGASACLYSLTKATSGHADLILGAVTTRDQTLRERLLRWRTVAGGIAGPFETWLALRGLRTLPLRIARQSDTALRLARWLARHPRVPAVHYPGLDGPVRAVAERQMRGGFGPLLSFELDGDAAAADAVVAAARVIRPATSFGGVGSTWERRARWPSETATETLIRLSVGIESPNDLIADLERALGALG